MTNQKQFSTSYTKSWALVIGIDRYKNDSLPPLETAESGAATLVEFLIKEMNFPADHIILLTGQQATKAVIESVVEDHLTDPNRVGKDDRLLIYYAGHGITRARTTMGSVGYIAPYDAEQGLWSTFIEMDEFIKQAAFMSAKHVLFLLDACFSGLALMRGQGSNEPHEEFLRRSARQIITAGTADQMISDRLLGEGHSIFTYFLLRGLRGQAANDGVLRASHLGMYLQDQVSGYTHGQQIPQVGRLVGDGGGDFIFKVISAETKRPAPRPADLDHTRLRPGVLRKDEYEQTLVDRPVQMNYHIAATEPTVQTRIAYDSERATLLRPPSRANRAKRRRLFAKLAGFW
ncbi:MAG: caspase family protein [Chloroflexi bacterium]|nr:caspase family protein [Chloroflexota bacterium]